MGFKINFDSEKVSSGFSIVKEGKYEATILTAEAKQLGGQWAINFDVEIRSDVKQEHQGAKVLYNTIFLTSSNSQYAEDTEKKRNSFLVACGYSGKQDLDLDQVVSEIIGKSVLVYVKHKEDRDGKVWPRVSFVAKSNTSPSQSAAQSDNGPIQVSESELPF